MPVTITSEGPPSTIKLSRFLPLSSKSKNIANFHLQHTSSGNTPNTQETQAQSQRQLALLLSDQELETDGTRRIHFEDGLKKKHDTYFKEEDDALDVGLATLTAVQADPNKIEVNSDSSLTKSFYLHSNGGNNTSFSTVELNCSFSQALAREWDVTADCMCGPEDGKRTMLEEVNPHNRVYIRVLKTRAGVWRRREMERVIRTMYKVSPAKGASLRSALVISKPCHHDARPRRHDRIRSMGDVVVKLVELPDDRCQYTYCCTGRDFSGGSTILRCLTNSYNRNVADLQVLEVQCYFQKLRKLDELGLHDGSPMGEAFTTTLEGEKKKAEEEGVKCSQVRVNNLISTYRSLRQLTTSRPFFSPMMVVVATNKFRTTQNVVTKLATLTKLDGENIGTGLALALITSTTSDNAVDTWVDRYPALVEFEEEWVWFRPMMNVVAKKLLYQNRRREKYKVYFKAALSICDMCSDVYMIVYYFNKGLRVYAWAVFATIAVNMFFQQMIVYGQNRRIAFQHIAKEMFITIICLKPAADAYKVSKHENKNPNHAVHAMDEMLFSRVAEIVAESLPNLIMQTVVLLESENKDKRAVVSIFISASTIAVTGTSLSWDLDTSPNKRRGGPDFYGYITNDPTSRIFTFFAMFTLTLSHVFIKALATALVISVSGTWMAIYLAVDLLFFFLFKIVRGDFRYWMNIPDPLSFFSSFIIRLIQKLLIDNTLCLHMRHPYEVGGVLFVIVVVQNQTACIVAVQLYLKYYQEQIQVAAIDIIGATTNTTIPAVYTDTKVEASMLWLNLSCLFALFVLSAAALVYFMDRNYLHTFVTTDTGPERAVKKYLGSTTDEQRMGIFYVHPSYRTKAHDELEALVGDNWANWMVNRPDWLTDGLIGSIEDKYIPVAEVKRLEKEGGGKRRRSSAFAGMGGDRRRGSKVAPDPTNAK